MEDISRMEEDIIGCTPTIPFSNTWSSVGMAVFVNPHKVVVQRNAFLVLGNVQNDGVLEVRIDSFGYASKVETFIFASGRRFGLQ